MKYLALFVMLGSVMVMAVPTYVTITYYIAQYPGGAYPSSIDAQAYIVYDAYGNPAHIITPYKGTYNSTTGAVTWSMPTGCYVRFLCRATGLDKTVVIPETSSTLNSLIPADPPPAPPWAMMFKTIDTPSGTDPVADCYNDTLTLSAGTGISITGASSTDTVTIANTAPDQTVTLTGAGITNISGTYPNFTITSTEADGSVTNEIQNIFQNVASQSGTATATTSTDTLTINGAGINATSVSGKTLTITGTEADTLDSVVQRGNTTEGNIAVRNISCAEIKGNAFNFAINDYASFVTNDVDECVYFTDSLPTQAYLQIKANNLTMYKSGSPKSMDALVFQTDDIIYTFKTLFGANNAELMFPEEGGLVWTNANDGSDSGLDADLLDGLHASSFLTSEEDGVVGNEVTNATNSTLTRSGSGTSGDPYTLKLNLANANTWTATQTFSNGSTSGGKIVLPEDSDNGSNTTTLKSADALSSDANITLPDTTTTLAGTSIANTFTQNQTAPYFIQSYQFNPNDPRPYGYPQTTANSNDEEFNGAGTPSGWSWLSGGTNITATQSSGYLKFSANTTGTLSGYYGKSISDGSYTFAGPIPLPSMYDEFVLILADSSGNGVGIYFRKGATANFSTGLATFTTWGAPSYSKAQNYVMPAYVGIRYDATNNKVTMAYSMDGINWTQPNDWTEITSGVPSTLAYVGFYVYFYTETNTLFKNKSYFINWLRVD